MKARDAGFSNEGASGEALLKLIRLLHNIYERLRAFGWCGIHNHDENPLYFLRYYAGMYSAQTLFDEHHTTLKVTQQMPSIIQEKEKNILAHIDACTTEIAALDEKKASYIAIRARLVSNHITAIINESKLHDEWYIRLGEPLLGRSHLEQYMHLALGRINEDAANDVEEEASLNATA